MAPATPPPPSQPIATPTPVIYEVQSGDTLIPIANRFGVSVADLIAANGNLDATRLQIGQRLVIPQAAQAGVTDDSLLLASPTPIAFEVRGMNSVRTPAGSLDILGEVFNPGPSVLGSVKIVVNLQDGAGNTVQNAVAITALDSIPPNQTSPFRVLFTDPPQAYANFAIAPLRGEPADAATAPIPLQVTRIDGRPDGAQFRVSGELLNPSVDTPSRVRLLVTIYDADKRVVGYRHFMLSESPLPPNTPLPFEVTLTTASPNVASFSAFAEGLR